MKDNPIYLSIVIPAYNEGLNISSTFSDISGYLKARGYKHEIILVDDGSTDNTIEAASAASKPFERFSLLKNNCNRGKGYSVKRGVLAAKGEYILFMDADNSTRIDQVERLLARIKDGCDAALASRRVPGAEICGKQPMHRILLGNIYIQLSRIILGTTVRDYNCGFKLFTQNAARILFPRLTRDDWSFDSELIFLISRFHLNAKEVPVKWQDKRTSKVRPLKDGINSLLSLFRIKAQAAQRVYD